MLQNLSSAAVALSVNKLTLIMRCVSHLAETVCTAHPTGGVWSTMILTALVSDRTWIRSGWVRNRFAVSSSEHLRYTEKHKKIRN